MEKIISRIREEIRGKTRIFSVVVRGQVFLSPDRKRLIRFLYELARKG